MLLVGATAAIQSLTDVKDRRGRPRILRELLTLIWRGLCVSGLHCVCVCVFFIFVINLDYGHLAQSCHAAAERMTCGDSLCV